MTGNQEIQRVENGKIISKNLFCHLNRLERVGVRKFSIRLN